MAKQLFTNNASTTFYSTTAGALTTTGTTVQVVDGSSLPAPTAGDYFLMTLYQIDGGTSEEIRIEVVKCTARSGNLLTVVRNVEDTVAGGTVDVVGYSYPQNTNDIVICELRMTAAGATNFLQAGDIGSTVQAFGSTGVWEAVRTTSLNPAVAGKSYWCDTTAAGFTMTLPGSPAANDKIIFGDYAGTFETKNLTVARNGLKINGATADYTCDINNEVREFVYVDSTQGWRVL